MNNAWKIAWRKSCNGLPQLSLPSTSRSLIRQFNTLSSKRWPQQGIYTLRPITSSSSTRVRPHNRTSNSTIRTHLQSLSSKRSLSTESKSLPSSSQTLSDPTTPLPQLNLTISQISSIFGTKIGVIPLSFATKTLQLLQKRRLNGTLDLDFPDPITKRLTPHQIESALQWLRRNYVVDEDAAIIARIEREDAAEEKEWAEKRKGDLQGEGVFAKVRRGNEERAEREEEERRKREEEVAAGLVKQAEKGPKGVTTWVRRRLDRVKVEDEAKDLMSPEERAEYISQKKYGKWQGEMLGEPVKMSKVCSTFHNFPHFSIHPTN
jgi:rhomboid-like protein